MIGIYCLEYFLLDSKVYHVLLLFHQWMFFIYFFFMKQVDRELKKEEVGFKGPHHLLSQC